LGWYFKSRFIFLKPHYDWGMFKKKRLTPDEIGVLFLLSALIFGSAFRILPPYLAGFPINDGGLFYKMIQAVQQNHYRLPEYVQYNGLDIPFVYPPFAFYLAGFIADLSGRPLIDIVLWFPAITLIAVIPAVYYFANVFLKSRLQAGLATFLYALLPRSITWLIMGGGVTRSLGQFFLIMAAANIYLLFNQKDLTGFHAARSTFITMKPVRSSLVLSILFSALVCLTHPEAALHTIGFAFILFLFYGRNKAGMINALIVILGTMLLSFPWWIVTLARFGPAPYLSAAGTGLNSLSYLIVLFSPFSGEPFMTIIAVFAILGFAAQIAKREYLLPILFVIPFIIEPRSAANVSIVPMALLASIAWTDLILPALSKMENAQFTRFLQSRAEKLLFFYLVFCLMIGMQIFALDFREKRLSPEHRAAFAWITQNTPADSKFLILTGKTDLFADPINEWFPVLSSRVSLTTIQGYEWAGRGEFTKRVPFMQGLQLCASLDCVESTAKEAGFDYNYIYIAGAASADANVIHELKSAPMYSSVYEKDSLTILKYPR
jgi:hypothetical protein